MENRVSSVISHTVKIRYAKEWAIFQIPVSRDADKIIGIEYGFHSALNEMLSPPFNRDRIGGRLLLESSRGIFFDQHLKVEESVYPLTELGYTHWNPGFEYYNNFLRDRCYHSRSREPEIVDVPAPNIIHGLFQDLWGPQQFRDMRYSFSIYVWYTLK